MHTGTYGDTSFNPLAALGQQLREQLAQIDDMARRITPPVQPGIDPAFVNTVREEVDRYMQERQQQAAVIPPSMQPIITAIESSLPSDDLKFLAGNISFLPDYFRSRDGKDLLGMMIDGLKRSGESSGINTTTTVAAPTRQTTG